MTAVLIYVFKASLCLGVFALVYRFIMRRSTHFAWDRLFLLGALTLSLALPLVNLGIKVEWLTPVETASGLDFEEFDSEAASTFLYNEEEGPYADFGSIAPDKGLSAWLSAKLSSEEDGKAEQSWFDQILPWLAWGLFLTWLLPGIWVGLRLGRRLRTIVLLRKNSDPWRAGKLSCVALPEGSGSFSWFKTLFLDRGELGSDQLPYILAHEGTHARQWHSLDVLFFELAEIAFWFHPGHRFLKRELRITHEFLADQSAAGDDPLHYSKVLLMLAGHGRPARPAHAFAGSQVGNRIQMLHQKRSHAMSKFKYLLILPLIAFFVSAFSLVPAEKSEAHTLDSRPLTVEYKGKGIEFAGESVPVDNPVVREKLEEAVVRLRYKSSVAMLAYRRIQKWQSFLLQNIRKEGLPDDFIFLALAESLLDPRAESPAGALGMWQIMEKTGTELGLVKNDFVDQRLDPRASTKAAATYLNRAKKRFGSWTSAAAAYNRGIPGLARDFEKQKGENYYELFLSKETNAYLYRILALKYLVLFPGFYGLNPKEMGATAPYDLREENLSAGTYFLPDLAKSQNVSFADLMHLNPWLIHPQYRLEVPSGEKYALQIPVSFEKPDPREMPSLYPLKGNEKDVSSQFGFTKSPFTKKERFHKGIDLKAEMGRIILAPADGKVIKVAESEGGYGIHVVIKHGDRYETWFGHMQSYSVREGQSVKKGDEIGKVGSTGLSTGPHLHYEIREFGFPVDPADFF